ncbi:MAG: hypothetical protein AAGI89_04375 [Pseudomonadota bacterium]
MRRYRDQSDLRKLTKASYAQPKDRKPGQPSEQEMTEAEIKHYAIIEAAAAIASAKAGDRMNRFLGVIVAALGLLGGGLVVLANLAIDLRIEEEFAERSNAVFGFVTVQRNIVELDRFFESEVERADDIEELEARESALRRVIDQVSEDTVGYMSRFRMVSAGEQVAISGLAGYVPSETDLYVLEYDIIELIDKISVRARGISHYQPITELGLANPEIAREARRFRVDFAYASGISLLSETSLTRDLTPFQELYDEHQRMLRELTNWPEYSFLFGLLIEDQLGSTDEELARIASGMADLSAPDFNNLIETIAEIAIDGSNNDQYRLAADRTYATFVEGCDVGGFVPRVVCEELNSMGVWNFFPAASGGGSLTSVGLSSPLDLSPRMDVWSAGLGGHIAATAHVEKPVSAKTAERAAAGRY